MEHPAGPHLDELADFIAMPGAVTNEGENQELGAALFQFAIEDC